MISRYAGILLLWGITAGFDQVVADAAILPGMGVGEQSGDEWIGEWRLEVTTEDGVESLIWLYVEGVPQGLRIEVASVLQGRRLITVVEELAPGVMQLRYETTTIGQRVPVTLRLEREEGRLAAVGSLGNGALVFEGIGYKVDR
jgi:hypothetical protein